MHVRFIKTSHLNLYFSFIKLAMNIQVVFLLAFFSIASSEWVLLPLVPKKNETKDHSPILVKNEFCPQEFKNVSHQKIDLCPDFHNLTSTSYANTKKKRSQPQTGWEISLEDVNELIRQSQQVPETTEGKAEFVRNLKEKLEIEAERRLKSLFPSGSREARTKYIDFPSMESSLMTISMLLFGVYLTKIILRLLQTQYRYNNMGMMMGGIRAPFTVTKGRRERSTSLDLEEINFLHLIDKYNTQFN